MKTFSGIDEVGYGPILGCYCTSVVSLEKQEDIDLFGSVAASKVSFLVCDSKKLYSAKKGIADIESEVLAWLEIYADTKLQKFKDILQALSVPKGSICYLDNSSIYSLYKDITLPISAKYSVIEEKKTQIKVFLKSNNINIKLISSNIVTHELWNKEVHISDNKSQAARVFIEPLLKKAFKLSDKIYIDRQGGRKFYLPWLYPSLGMVDVLYENKYISSYYKNGVDILFEIKADNKYFEVALASMISKYLREVLMMAFNTYWKKKYPSLPITTGYYVDAMKFLTQLEEEGIDISKLIRTK